MLCRTFFAITAVVAVAGGTTIAQENPRLLPKPDDKPGAAGKPIKVFMLMGQSSVVGMGDLGPETAKGRLTHLTKTDKKYSWLVDGHKWTERKDVYYYDARLKKGGGADPDREQWQVHRPGTRVRVRHGTRLGCAPGRRQIRAILGRRGTC